MTESRRADPEVTDELTVRRDGIPVSENREMPIKFGRYSVVEIIGRGGFGAVYEGFDTQLQRKVAIKVPRIDRDARLEFDRFQSEAQNLAKLHHPNIVAVFDVGLEDDRFYIVTERLEGVSLFKWLRNNAPSWQQSAKIVAQVSDALAHAHARKVIHRDIKPDNIIMTPDRGPVLVDFGLALAGQNSGDEIGTVRGTLRYMAPEQVEGLAHRIDGRTDIYALGMILYRMLTATVPFESDDSRELRRQIVHDAPQPPRQICGDIPEALEQICLRAPSKSMSQRYTTAADMSARLCQLETAGEDAQSTRSESNVAAESPASGGSISASTSVPVAGRRHVTVMHVTANVRTVDGDPEIDPEDQMEAVRIFQKECRAHFDRFGGSLLSGSGQELLVCFGYPLSYEDAPRRAVHAGLAVQESCRQLAQDLAARLAVRLQVWISIHSGIVVASGPSAESLVGDVLTLVTKIDRETQPSEVVITDDTQRLVNNRFHCEPLDASCALPGENPIGLHRVDHVKSHEEESSDEPSVEYTPLVGRDQEVSMLLDRWELVAEGYGHMVALIGDAGLGKSRLVQVIRRHVQETTDLTDPPIIEWLCSPYHTASAFHPAKEALQKLLGFERAPSETEKRQRLKTHLSGLDVDLAQTLPLFCELLSLPQDPDYPLPAISSPKQQELTLEHLRHWLGAASRKRPTLFIVEDLHWVDPSTLEFLHQLADAPLSDACLCLITFRPEFSTPWTSRAHQTQIALNRLTRSQVLQMFQSKIDSGNIASGVIQRIAERTDGVPLFVEEYAKMLNEAPESLYASFDQMSDSAGGSHSSSLTIPTTLQGLLMARLDRIDGDPNVVRLAATLGREFTFAMLAAACDLTQSHLETELEKLVQSQVLFRRGPSPSGSYQFKHALIQDAAYDSMLRRQRKEMHQRIADALQETFPETIDQRPEVLAHHRAEAGQPMQAAPLWEAAGSMATSRGEFVEAVQHLQLGMEQLQALPESSQRDELEYRMNVPLGIATLSLKGYAAPELGSIYDRRMELCRKLGDPMGQLHAKWAMASWRIVRDEVKTCLDIGEQMMHMGRAMDDDGALMEALFIQAIAQFYHGDFQDSLSRCRQGWELFDSERCLFHASRTGQHAGVAHLCYMSLNHWYLGQPASALRRMREALELAESLDHPFSVAFALHHFGWLNTAMRRGSEAVACGERQMEVSRDQAFYFWETTGMLFRAGGLIWLDRDEEAVEGLLEGLQRYQSTGAELALPQYHGFLAAAQTKLGDFDAASQSLQEGLAAVEKMADRFHEPELWRLRGQLSFAKGESDQAHRDLHKAIETAKDLQAASWQLAALLDLYELAEDDRVNVINQISDLLDRFEPCDEEIPILAQASAIVNP